jgi:hypothetical protein
MRCTFVTAANMQCLLDSGHTSGHDVLGDMVIAAAEGKCLKSYILIDDCQSCDLPDSYGLCARRSVAPNAEEADLT